MFPVILTQNWFLQNGINFWVYTYFSFQTQKPFLKRKSFYIHLINFINFF